MAYKPIANVSGCVALNLPEVKVLLTILKIGGLLPLINGRLNLINLFVFPINRKKTFLHLVSCRLVPY